MAKNDKEGKEEKPEPVHTGGWDDNVKVRLREFNGPAAASDPLRIAMTKEAYADLIGHAKESLDKEICGVLLGDLCEDEYGRFLDIRAALRGGAAKGGGTHVTFTQETWNEIHAAKEDRFPKLQIVGWYHSHPGFGVEFSDMDRFIQQNFFGGPGQIAFVTDPLGGEEAIDANVDGRLTHVERFWVDGRERRCYVPRSAQPAAAAGTAGDGSPGAENATAAGGRSGGSTPSDLTKRLDDLQDRVRQLTDAIEKQRSWFYNLITFLGMLIAASVLVAVGLNLWWGYIRPPIPVEVLGSPWTVPTPIAGPDGKPIIVTLEARSIAVPPEMQATMLQNLVLQNRAAVAALLKALDENDAKTRPATASAPATPASAPASAPKAP